MNCLPQVPPQYLCRIKVNTSRLSHSKTWTLFCCNHALVEQLVCLLSLSFFMSDFLLTSRSWTDTLTFSCRICWYNSELIALSMITSYPGPGAAKQAQTMVLPPICFTDEIRFLCLNEGFVHHQTKCFSFKPKSLILVSSVHRTFFQSPSGLSTLVLTKLQTAVMFLFGKLWLSPCNPITQTFDIQCSPDGGLMNIDCSHSNKGL